ncbi:MAG: GyrI-like domain-containing protein, partial [Flavobacteriales bacterium]
MLPEIRLSPPKLLLGQSLTMSIANNRTGDLWQSFAPKIKEVPNKVNNDKYSLQVYPVGYFEVFNPMTEFVKHALVEVSAVNRASIPDGMSAFKLERGLYAVFHFKGSSADPSIYQYIYTDWLPKSRYQLDTRPHFELL